VHISIESQAMPYPRCAATVVDGFSDGQFPPNFQPLLETYRHWRSRGSAIQKLHERYPNRMLASNK
jgi:hypothetical protein